MRNRGGESIETVGGSTDVTRRTGQLCQCQMELGAATKWWCLSHAASDFLKPSRFERPWANPTDLCVESCDHV